MTSIELYFKSLIKERYVLIVSSVALLMLVSILGMIYIPSEPPWVPGKPNFENTRPDPYGVKKADSDYYYNSSGHMIHWPDKLSDVEETYLYGTNWTNPDTDGDGMEDGWEAFHQVWDPVRREFTLDPNRADAMENPDGDGFDSDHNGVIDDQEGLFNLREYAGGAPFDWENDTFTEGGSIFGGLDPLRDHGRIGRMGGFHLYDDPSDGISGDIKNPDKDTWDDYLRYDPFNPNLYKPVTTNPSLWDTDSDGMDDGWEYHHARELKEKFFQDDTERVWSGSVELETSLVVLDEIIHMIRIDDAHQIDWTSSLIDPLDPLDSRYDMDIRFCISYDRGYLRRVPVLYRDGLTNLEEFQNGTSPILWDTDGDSFYYGIKGEFFQLDDKTEIDLNYWERTKWASWDCMGMYPRLDPCRYDMDGDGMGDGYELCMGLDPFNATDRLKDLDCDGLNNLDEFMFSNADGHFFTTDPKDPDTDGDGIPDGWESFNARAIQVKEAKSLEQDLLDGIIDGLHSKYTVSPMVNDAGEDNDGWWDLSEFGEIMFTSTPDGMSNLEEYYGTVQYQISTDPNSPDTDGDGLLDSEEIKIGFKGELMGGKYFTDQNGANTYYTNATRVDSDNDFGGSKKLNQMGNISRSLDDWEETNGRTKKMILSNGFDDDRDGIIDEYEGEYLIFDPTNATSPDTDLDGWMDVDELFGIDTTLLWDGSTMGTIMLDPCNQDTDGDMLSDYDELQWIHNYREWITDPTESDTDKDGMDDHLENTVDLFPYLDYFKNDNYPGFEEEWWLIDDPPEDWMDLFNTVDRTDPTISDTDGDGMPDGWEYRYGMIVYGEDPGQMGLIMEYITWIDWLSYPPQKRWTGPYCGERFWIVNPLVNDAELDPDNDHLTNYEEYLIGTDPLNPDTDGDGMPDGWEMDPENRGEQVWNIEKSRYEWTLDPLNPDDWCLDPDHDGYTFSFYVNVPPNGSYYELVDIYFPWINLYEYRNGIDTGNDGINDITDCPAPGKMGDPQTGGYDTNSNGIIDGEEFWVNDMDNDSLPRGWEELFNGSMWNRPECYPYIHSNGSWDPFHTSITVGRDIFIPCAFQPGNEGQDLSGHFWFNRRDSNMDGVYDNRSDVDGDGNTSWDEFMGHTDPTDPTAYPGNPDTNIPPRRSRSHPPLYFRIISPTPTPRNSPTISHLHTSRKNIPFTSLSPSKFPCPFDIIMSASLNSFRWSGVIQPASGISMISTPSISWMPASLASDAVMSFRTGSFFTTTLILRSPLLRSNSPISSLSRMISPELSTI